MSASSTSCREFEPTADMAVWVESLIDDDITVEQHAALGQFLMENMAACRYFLDEMQLHAALKWDGLERVDPSVEVATTERHLSPAPTFLSTTLHGTIGYLSQEVLFSFFIAAVFTGLLVLILSLVPVSSPVQIATNSSPMPSVGEPKIEFVGRITGMVDVKWADATTAPLTHLVALGRKYSLASGLMEITYETGAKVILQGPVTYEVESKNGGFLSAGKLTGKVEVERAKDFAIRTPTATVVDLGTEFGVEVDKQGATLSHVFRGAVRLYLVAEKRDSNEGSIVLHENETARTENQRGAGAPAIVLCRVNPSPQAFVRTLHHVEPILYRQVVLDDRPLVYWPLTDAPGTTWVDNIAGSGYDGQVCGNVRFARPGPLADDRSRAIEFTGDGYIEVAQLPNSDLLRGFTLEAWARDDAEGNQKARSVLTYRDESAGLRSGFMLYAGPGWPGFWSFCTGSGMPNRSWDTLTGSAVHLGQWTHIAAIFEPSGREADGAVVGVKKLYINGAIVAHETQPILPNDRRPLRIGAGVTESSEVQAFFQGRIAEVAVYDRPLSEHRVMIHYKAMARSNRNTSVINLDTGTIPHRGAATVK